MARITIVLLAGISSVVSAHAGIGFGSLASLLRKGGYARPAVQEVTEALIRDGLSPAGNDTIVRFSTARDRMSAELVVTGETHEARAIQEISLVWRFDSESPAKEFVRSWISRLRDERLCSEAAGPTVEALESTACEDRKESDVLYVDGSIVKGSRGDVIAAIKCRWSTKGSVH